MKKNVDPLVSNICTPLLKRVWYKLTSYTFLKFKHLITYYFFYFFGKSSKNWLQECISQSGIIEPFLVTEVWLCLLADMPPVRKLFPFGVDSWSIHPSSNTEHGMENFLHFSSSTGMSGAASQEGFCFDLTGSWGSRECVPEAQNNHKKFSSAGLGVLFITFISLMAMAKPSQ